MTDVASYEAAGTPLVSVVRDDDTLKVSLAEVDSAGTFTTPSLAGLAPEREPNDEEIAFGITSLNPPAGSTTLGEQRLIDIAVRATQAAVESSGALDAASAIVIAQKIQHAVRSALAALPEETTAQGIGTVYTP